MRIPGIIMRISKLFHFSFFFYNCLDYCLNSLQLFCNCFEIASTSFCNCFRIWLADTVARVGSTNWPTWLALWPTSCPSIWSPTWSATWADHLADPLADEVAAQIHRWQPARWLRWPTITTSWSTRQPTDSPTIRPVDRPSSGPTSWPRPAGHLADVQLADQMDGHVVDPPGRQGTK